MKKLFVALLTVLTLVFTGCDPGNNNPRTTLTINNMSSYNLLSVEYGVNFGTINSGRDATKDVSAGTRYVYFKLLIKGEQVSCRTAVGKTCVDGETNELTIHDGTSIFTNNIIGELQAIVEELSRVTTLTINNTSDYNLLNVQYGSTQFENINSGTNSSTKEVNPGTGSIFFYLLIGAEQIRCRTNEITCVQDINNPITIANDTSITTIPTKAADSKTGELQAIVEELSRVTTLTIINTSDYNLLNVEYASVPFGNINSGGDGEREVSPGTRSIFFYLSIDDEQIRCKIDGITCVQDINNEVTITNNRSITTTVSEMTDSLKNIIDTLTIELNKPQIKVNQGEGGGNSTSRTIMIDMFDSYGDGWNGSAALRIKVNGVDIATNVRVQNGNANTYSFEAAGGDVVQMYWVSGTDQAENSFVVYYADTPPSPAFNASNNNSWNGSNALIYRLRGTMNISNGSLLGSFTVPVDSSNTLNQYGEYDFGSVAAGTISEITFTIENTGRSNLTIETINGNKINLTENTTGYFSVNLQPLSPNIAPGNTTTFTIRFNPTAVGNNFAATVQIKTNSRDNDEFVFRVKGNWRSLAVGDTGPGGGTIFFAQGGQYKECSGELGTYNWTDAMTTAQAYRGGNFTNWRLPDRGEMEIMYQNRTVLGGFFIGSWDTSNYWTSTESSTTTYAWRHSFFYGTQDSGLKTSSARVRAVRSFSLQ